MDCDSCLCTRNKEIRRGEKDAFWEELKGHIEVCKDRWKVVVIGDMNTRVRDSEVEGVTGKSEVSGMNEKGGKLIELCMEKKMSVEIMYVFLE